MASTTGSSGTTRPPSALRRISRALLALAGLALGLVAVEFGSRLIAPRFGFGSEELESFRAFLVDGTNIEYEGRAHILYSRVRAREEINSNGFIGPEWPIARTAGVPRIVCMGGSTTEGVYDLGTPGSYPFFLEDELEERTGRDFEVFNAGMSGWTTAEMTVAWFLSLKDFRPDLVLINEAVNDSEPRMYPDYRSDYSHYRKTWEMPRASPLTKWIVAHSHLAAWLLYDSDSHFIATMVNREASGESGFDGERYTNDSAGAFRRNVLSIARDARADGATVVLVTMPIDPSVNEENRPGIRGWIVGTLEHNEILRELAREHGFILVDLERAFHEPQPELAGDSPVFFDLVHVIARGDECKARLIADVLQREWLVGLPAAASATAQND